MVTYWDAVQANWRAVLKRAGGGGGEGGGGGKDSTGKRRLL